jgi:hypothetical protein
MSLTHAVQIRVILPYIHQWILVDLAQFHMSQHTAWSYNTVSAHRQLVEYATTGSQATTSTKRRSSLLSGFFHKTPVSRLS